MNKDFLVFALLVIIFAIVLAWISPRKTVYEYHNPNIVVKDLGVLKLDNGTELLVQSFDDISDKLPPKIGFGIRTKF